MPPNVLQSEAPTNGPTALSFREFRDEEIAGFFANGQRTFRPPTVSSDGVGRQRFIGAAHPPSERKPTAAFCAVNARKMRDDRLSARREKSVLCHFPPPTIPLPTGMDDSILPSHPFDRPTRPLAVIARGIRKPLPNTGRAAKVLFDPLAVSAPGSEEQPPHLMGIPIDGGLDDLGEKRPTQSDDGLTKIVERWPRLPATVRVTIGTLVETIQ